MDMSKVYMQAPESGADVTIRSSDGVASAPELSDDAREKEIEAARVAMNQALTGEGRRLHWQHMRALISQRSQEQIAKLEKERGLV